MTALVEMLFALIVEGIKAAQSSDPVEAERQVLLSASRKISDELERRELAK